MVVSKVDQFHPSMMFGFIDGKLHQLWVNPLGMSEYRPVPVVETSGKPACVAGYDGEDGNGEVQ